MRRFLCIGPDVYIGARGSWAIRDAKLVRAGQVAILHDDDPRCADLARNPLFNEVDEDNNVIEYVEPTPAPAPVYVAPAPPPAPEPVVTFDYPAVSTADPEPEPEPEVEVEEEVARMEDEGAPPAKTRKRRAVSDDAESEVGGEPIE